MKDPKIVKFVRPKKSSDSKFSRYFKGKTYTVIVYALLLTILGYSFYSVTQTEPPAVDVSRATLPQSSINESGDISVTIPSAPDNPLEFRFIGKINGSEVVFVLDTGATSIAVPLAIANELNLKRGSSFEAETAAGRSKSYTTLLNTVSVGDITLGNVPAGIATRMDTDYILLGMTFLAQLELRIENGNAILTQKMLRSP